MYGNPRLNEQTTEGVNENITGRWDHGKRTRRDDDWEEVTRMGVSGTYGFRYA